MEFEDFFAKEMHCSRTMQATFQECYDLLKNAMST